LYRANGTTQGRLTSLIDALALPPRCPRKAIGFVRMKRHLAWEVSGSRGRRCHALGYLAATEAAGTIIRSGRTGSLASCSRWAWACTSRTRTARRRRQPSRTMRGSMTTRRSSPRPAVVNTKCTPRADHWDPRQGSANNRAPSRPGNSAFGDQHQAATQHTEERSCWPQDRELPWAPQSSSSPQNRPGRNRTDVRSLS
jgi:hypothetical protein